MEGAMKDVPNTLELLGGVARFLKEDIRTSVTDPALRYRTLVAANIVRIVMSELQMRREPLAAGADDDQLLAHLRAELAAVNPRFDLRDDIESMH